MSRRPPFVVGSHVDNAVARTSRDGWWTAAACVVGGMVGGALVVFLARAVGA